jgi:hypothetical protein
MSRFRAWQWPLLRCLGLPIEPTYLACLKFREPNVSIAIDVDPSWPGAWRRNAPLRHFSRFCVDPVALLVRRGGIFYGNPRRAHPSPVAPYMVLANRKPELDELM